METNQARTLAYNLAKELDHKELDEISGGGNNWVSCQRGSLTPSGQFGSLDATVDYTIDW